MLLSGNLSNRYHGNFSLVIREETAYPIPVDLPTDGLSQFTRKYGVMIASGYRLIFLLSSAGGYDLTDIPFCLSVSHQAFMETPIPDVHPPVDLCPDLPCPTDTHNICKDDVGKDKGLLGVPGPPEYPLTFRSQYGREPAPYCA